MYKKFASISLFPVSVFLSNFDNLTFRYGTYEGAKSNWSLPSKKKRKKQLTAGGSVGRQRRYRYVLHNHTSGAVKTFKYESHDCPYQQGFFFYLVGKRKTQVATKLNVV